MRWTNGNVAFASGSPFEPMTHDGSTRYPAQANNAYVFPALGHAAVLAGAREMSDDVFLAAAESLAVMTTEKELRAGKLFPDFDAIQDIRRAHGDGVREDRAKWAGPETAGGHGLARARGERVLPAAGGSRDAREALTTRRRMVRE